MGIYYNTKTVKYVCIERTLSEDRFGITHCIDKGEVFDMLIQDTFMSYNGSTIQQYYKIGELYEEIDPAEIKNFITLAEWRENQINDIIE